MTLIETDVNWLLNPAIALSAYLIAIATSMCLLRLVPSFDRMINRQTGQRYGSIDGLRGYLAFGVFVHHVVVFSFYLQHGRIELPSSNFYSQLGQASVALFFMITGFLFWGRLLDKGPALNWKDFAISRFCRLYPLYLALLGVVLLIVFGEADWRLKDEPADLLQQLALWLIFDRPDINQHAQSGLIISNVTWTLNYELFFYAVLPLLSVVFLQRPGWLKGIFAVLMIYALYQLFGLNHSLKRWILFSFCGGIAAAYWIRHPQLRIYARSTRAAVLALLSLLLVMTCFQKSFHLLPLLLLSLFFIIVASGNDLFGLLRLRAIRWMGEISYSTYLLHGILLWMTFSWVLPKVENPTAIWILLPTIWLLSSLLIIISSITFRFIEMPGMQLGKRWSKRQQGKASSPTSTKSEEIASPFPLLPTPRDR